MSAQPILRLVLTKITVEAISIAILGKTSCRTALAAMPGRLKGRHEHWVKCNCFRIDVAMKTAKYDDDQHFCKEMEIGLLREAEIMAMVGCIAWYPNNGHSHMYYNTPRYEDMTTSPTCKESWSTLTTKGSTWSWVCARIRAWRTSWPRTGRTWWMRIMTWRRCNGPLRFV